MADGREWLWSRPDAARWCVSPGDRFVDVGGVEECFPTVRGAPDHGDVWSRRWDGSSDDAWVETDQARLTRRLSTDGGEVRATYGVSAEPGFAFVHATHTLLDLSVDAVVETDCDRVLLVDGPGPVEATWPSPLGLPLERFGPDDGSATGMVLTGCTEVAVVDGADALTFSLAGDVPLSTALWRNLRGFPVEAPYRSTGVEPLVGNGFDRTEPGAAAVVPASGAVWWAVTVRAWRRS
jgi:hypothetical protein